MIERLILLASLGVLLDFLGFGYSTQEYWAILLAIIAYGWILYRDGYNDATELAQASWQQAKRTLEEAIAREERVQQLIKDYKDIQ